MNDPIKKWLDIKDNSLSSEQLSNSELIKGKFNEANKTFDDGLTRTIEFEKIIKSGRKQFFQITIAPLFNLSGEIYQIVELIQDVTEKKILEAEMLHSSKMAIVGTMAASIAHEVGNPLSSISTRLKLLESKKRSPLLKPASRCCKKKLQELKEL